LEYLDDELDSKDLSLPDQESTTGVNKLDVFLNNINRIVNYFQTHQINLNDGSTAILSYPKYLTSMNLFELQLNDSSFRKTILTQFQVVLRSFLKPISMIQKRLFIFKEQDKTKINETLGKIKTLFDERHNNKITKLFAEEEMWETWKETGCPTYEKPTTEGIVNKLLGKKSSESGKPRSLFKVDMIGNYDFCDKFEVNHNELQNIGVTLRFNENVNSDNPFLGNYIEKISKDMDPSMEIEEQEKLIHIDPVSKFN
jgi:THO complex subunit 1